MNKTASLNDSPALRQKTPPCVKDLPFRDFLMLFAALLSVSAYPALFIYCHNIKEAVFTQVFSPIFLYAAIGLAAWLLFWIMTAKMPKGAFIALLFLLVFMNYGLIENGIRVLVPGWRWWRIAPAFLFLFINLALFFRVFIKNPEADAVFTKISLIIGAVFLILTLFNAARAGFAMTGPPQPDSSMAATPSPSDKAPVFSSNEKRPNFYYFIFDEYARQDVLKQYSGYDNTPFLKMLEAKGFNISYSSYSDSWHTEVSIGNLLHCFNKFKKQSETTSGIKRPPLFEIFKNAGYRTYALCPMYKMDKSLIDRELMPATVLAALSVEKMVLAKSFMAYVRRDSNESYRADWLALLEQAAAVAAEKAEKPKFLFFHFMGPHAPFVFDEYGESVAYESRENYANPLFYTGQLRFLTEKILNLTSAILEKDPHALVLMQSDHGIRFFKNMQEKEKRACFNSLYMDGQKINIEGLGATNTLRLALQHSLKLKLDPLRLEQ